MTQWRALLLGPLCLLFGVVAYAQQLTIIELRHRTADELLPLLRPMVSDGAGLTGADYRLLVRASDADVARLREALTVLDRAAKQLMISVRYASKTDIDREQAHLTGRAGSNGAQISLSAGQSGATSTAGNVSSVRVTEGQAAFVASGQSIPMVSAVFTTPRIGNRSGGVGATLEHREVSTGFNVQPRVNGEQVTLDVSAQQQQLTGNERVVMQRVSTNIAGRVGEWLSLGSATESTTTRNTTLNERRVATASDQREIWVKVELIGN
ncbi:MAG: hypothetical protein H7Y02_05935 [Candidatus Obscuribacterales bacterium]|nr:hypothetical protein [Steroidobacteraceae bacterium]